LYCTVPAESGTVLLALSTSDGAARWRFPDEHRMYTVPVLDSGLVYTTTVEGMVYALRASDGVEMWAFEAGQIITASPTVADGLIYVAPAVNAPEQPYVYVLNASTGALRWSAPVPDSTAHRLTVHAGVLYIATHHGCAALSATNGALLWSRDLPSWGPRSAPVVIGDTVCLSTRAIPRRVRQEDGTIEHTPAQGQGVALRASDGAHLWQRDLDGAQSPTELAAFDDVLYVGSDAASFYPAGNASVYALRSQDGAIIWQAATEGERLATPVAASDAVYVGASDGCVYAVRASDGTRLWRTFTSTAVSMAMAISGELTISGDKPPA
ncbi:MAG TPA: PQQ-binding-like beta-propeller repeat protein, partial [Ktedonobacterales bacterium]